MSALRTAYSTTANALRIPIRGYEAESPLLHDLFPIVTNPYKGL